MSNHPFERTSLQPAHKPPLTVMSLPKAGKRILVRQPLTGQQLVCPHIQLDPLYWAPNWSERHLIDCRAST